MLENKFSKVINRFKAKPSTSAKTLSAGLLAAGNIGITRALSRVNISELQGNSEGVVNKQDLISLYSKIAQEENYDMYADNLNDIQSRILECKPESISNSVAEKFHRDGWNITSSDGSSLLTVAIEKIREKNIDCDIHVQIAVSLILNMKKELIIGLKNFADSNGKTLLHYLAESDKEDVLRLVIESSNFNIKEAVRSKDRDNKTPLHYAAKSGNKECFETLIENEAHFTSTINYKSELHYAAESGNFILLKYLEKILTAKGTFEREKIKTDRYGNNALHYAAQSGNAECIKFCIDNRVQFLKNQYNENPLHKIAGNSETQDNAINFLIEHLKLLGRIKSKINREDADGNTPLHIAAQHRNKQLIEVFIRLGGKIVKNQQGNTPLHIAVMHGHTDCIELFIEKHENEGDSILESKGEHERDLVHLAAMHGQFNCLDFLLKKFPNYDLNTKTSKGNTALHLALSSNTETELRKKCVRLLTDRGIQVNESNNEGNTPLHFAVQLDLPFLSMIEKEFEEQEIDVYKEILRENHNDNTAFHMAACVGNQSCLKHLFSLIQQEEIGEILSKKNEYGQTLLHLSMLSGSIKCVEYLIQKSPIDIFSEQSTQKLLFPAALSGNNECLEFLVRRLVDRNVADSVGVLFSYNDENDNTPLHMAALADGIGCSQYIIESVSKLTIRNTATLFNTNIHGLTPIHFAAMILNAEVIEYFITKNHPYAEKILNIVSKSGRTPLHYLVMNDNDFERIVDKQDQFLKNLILEKRKQNEHLREKAISALFYLTINNKEKIVNKKINFDIKDNAEKTALDYALEHSDANILRLFLDVFYEIKEDRKKKYDKFKIDYQEKQKKILRFNGILAPMTSIIIMICILSGQSKSPLKTFFTIVSMICCLVSLLFASCSVMISYQKRSLKNDIKNYTEKIDRIEEVTGELTKTKVEVHDLEGYSTMLEQVTKHAEDIAQLESTLKLMAENIAQLESTLNKLMHEVSSKSRDKLDTPSQGMSRRGSAAPYLLADRRSSSCVNDATKKLGLYAKRNSRVQDPLNKCDSKSCLIAKNEDSKSNQEALQSKLKTAVNKLRVGNIFRKKKNLVDIPSLLEKKIAVKKDEEKHIKQPADTCEHSIFSTPFNPSCSTLREEFCTAGTGDRTIRRMSYGSTNKLSSVSEGGASKFPSATLSSPGAEVAIKEIDFLGLECRPRVNSSPPHMSKREIAGRIPKSGISSDHIGRGKEMRIVVTDPDNIDFQRSDSKHSSEPIIE